jgi:hypothetical protein
MNRRYHNTVTGFHESVRGLGFGDKFLRQILNFAYPICLSEPFLLLFFTRLLL